MVPSNLEIAYTEQQLAAMQTSLIQMLATYITVMAIVGLALTILMIAATWRIFKKAGTGGWKALIPIYSDYTLYKIAWKKKYFFLMLGFIILSSVLSNIQVYFSEYAPILMGIAMIFSIAAIVIDIISIVKLAKAFRKGGGFAVGLILLPLIFYPILGFDKAKYRRRKRRKQKALPAPETV